MSRKNGDRSRHNRIRKSRMQARSRIRDLRKSLELKEPVAKSEPVTA
jgi:hypothetical protein